MTSEIIVAAQERIGQMLRTGATLDYVDEHVIARAPLTRDQKAALWLYAWSLLSRAEQRRMAHQHLDDVASG